MNRTVTIQMAPIHAAVILDLLLMLTEGLVMVKQPLKFILRSRLLKSIMMLFFKL